MEAPYGKPVVCPTLIGREPQLDTLHRWVDAVKRGRGQTTLISGEAGVGKSRLAAEARSYAASQGFLVLQGHCFPPDVACPYAPLLDLLRVLFAAHSPAKIVRVAGAAAPELVKLLPELAALVPGLTPSPALEPEQEQRRLFQTLTWFCTHLTVNDDAARPTPLMMLVEDIHWSDDTSLEFLLHLARRIAAQPILLLLTYRSDEPRPALAHFLAELDHARLAPELALVRLARDEVELMLRAIFELERPVRAEFLDATYALTEGNPFFIEEVLTSLIAAGDIFYADGAWDGKPMSELRIPRSVQDAVRQRTARLSQAARRLLTLAAVAGRQFDFTVLRHATRHDEDEVLAQIKELVAAQLVVEVSSERFAFRHALTRQAVAGELLARERKALHQQLAEALEQVYAGTLDAHLADLADHYYEAGVWAKALEYARRAGERAQALYTPRAAIAQFSHALDAAHMFSRGDLFVQLYRARGLAYETVGEFEFARGDHEAALQAAQEATDRLGEWQALIDLGHLWASQDYARTGDYFQRALELARAIDDPSAIAHSLNRVGNWYMNVIQPPEALPFHEEALAIFERLDDRRGRAETLDLLGMASYLGGDSSRGATYYERAIALFRELDDRQGMASSLPTLVAASGCHTSSTVIPAQPLLVEAARGEALAVRIAREIGWRAGEAYALLALADTLGYRGAFGRALAAAQEGFAVAQSIEHHQWMALAHLQLGRLYLELLATESAHEYLENALARGYETGSSQLISLAAADFASGLIIAREHTRAEAILNAVPGAGALPRSLAQRTVWCARGELALARGDPAAALQIVDQLLASAAHIEDYGERGIPRLAKLRGEALAALHRRAEAEAALLNACDGAAEQGVRRLLWRAHVALGKLYLSQRRHGDAEQSFAAARAIVEELAANVPDEQLRDTFLHRATAMLPRPRPPTPRQAAKQAFGGLTAREREVAALIAQGNSNREIAEALVVSERTVEGYVSNILGKLAFGSRAQIAAWAVETGLAKLDA